MTLMTILVTFWLYSSSKDHSGLVAMLQLIQNLWTANTSHILKWNYKLITNNQNGKISAGIFILLVELLLL
jgi:hypothetical protein